MTTQTPRRTPMDELGRQAQALLIPHTGVPRRQPTLSAARTPPLAPTERTTPWVMVTGGKGGVGKTVLAVNLAILLARAGQRILLVDLDPGLGNVDVHLRIGNRWSIEDLADGLCTPEAAVARGPGNIDVLTGRSGSTRLTGGDPDAIQQVLDAVADLGCHYDVVLCDSGAGIGPLVMETARRSHLVLAVTTPDPSSLTDTYALCKVLDSQGIPLPSLVLNQVGSKDQAMSHAAKLRSVARRFLAAEPDYAGGVRADRGVARSAVEQRPYALHGEGEVLDDLRALTSSVLGALSKASRTPMPRPDRNPLLVRPT